MTQAMLDEWMGRITYKPGWSLRARLCDCDAMVEITVGFLGDDSARELTIPRWYHHKLFVPAVDLQFEGFANAVLRTVHELETHETREWFRVDRRPWTVPHEDGAAIYNLNV